MFQDADFQPQGSLGQNKARLEGNNSKCDGELWEGWKPDIEDTPWNEFGLDDDNIKLGSYLML